MPLIASVGRIVEQKGSDLAAAVLPKLLRATEAQVVVAGDGDASLVKKMQEAVAKGNGRAVFARVRVVVMRSRSMRLVTKLRSVARRCAG